MWISHRGNHALDPCFNQGVGAGWGSAVKATRFERHISRGTFCVSTRFFQGDYLRVGFASLCMIATTNHGIVLDEQAPDARIGMRRVKPLFREL